MKKTLLSFILSIYTCLLFAQFSEGPNNPKYAESAPFGCLSCKGIDWLGLDSVYLSDDKYTIASIYGGTSCTSLGVTCFYSKLLIVSDFGFNLPSGSLVNGIEARVSRFASADSAIADSSIHLLFGGKGMRQGSNMRYAKSFWSSAKTKQPTIYGSSSNTWGVQNNITDAEVNDSNFGVGIKAYNTSSDNQVAIDAMIDYVTMDVYYSTTTSIGVQSKSKNSNLSFSYNFIDKKILLSLNLNSAVENTSVEVFNALGQKQLAKSFGSMNSGNYTEQLDASGLSKGMYIVKLQAGKTELTQKIIIQ